MLEAIEDNDFEKGFLNSGIFKKQAPFMGCIPRRTCFFSESGQKLVEKLKKNRDGISDFVSQAPANVERNLALVPVFPRLAIGVGFEDLINRLTAMRLDLFPPTKATTGFTLVITAILLALIATMEVMKW